MRPIYNSIKNSEILNYEPNLAADIANMTEHGEKCSLIAFTLVRLQGGELYIVEWLAILTSFDQEMSVVVQAEQVSSTDALLAPTDFFELRTREKLRSANKNHDREHEFSTLVQITKSG